MSTRRVGFEEVDWDDDLRLLHGGEPFSGEVAETHPNGQVIAVTSYLDGWEHGPAEEWYPTGELRARGSAEHSRAVGLHQEWHRNGRLAVEAEFDDTGRRLSSRRWDEQGEPIS